MLLRDIHDAINNRLTQIRRTSDNCNMALSNVIYSLPELTNQQGYLSRIYNTLESLARDNPELFRALVEDHYGPLFNGQAPSAASVSGLKVWPVFLNDVLG